MTRKKVRTTEDTVMVSVRLDRDLVNFVDHLAHVGGLTRTGFIDRCLRRGLAAPDENPGLQNAIRERALHLCDVVADLSTELGRQNLQPLIDALEYLLPLLADEDELTILRRLSCTA